MAETAPPTSPGAPATPAKPTIKRVRMRDVADQANVSVATVSMVLNNSGRISPATHRRVKHAIEKTGYRPNRMAQGLSGQYTRVLGILLPPLRHALADAYFGEIISGICDKADKLGYTVQLEQAKPGFIKHRKHLELFERRCLDGILAVGVSDRHHFLADFQDRSYPLIVVNNRFDHWKLDHVVSDYRGGAEQAMNYLTQLGHRRIGLITAAPEVRTTREIVNAYRDKLAALGFRVDETWMADGRFTEEGGAEAARALMQHHPEMTAVFAGNDKMAVGAIYALTQRGVCVPADVSIVGCDDIQPGAFITPSLTTIHTPLYEVGAVACERLIERVMGKVAAVAETLPTHLVFRDSTALPRELAGQGQG